MLRTVLAIAAATLTLAGCGGSNLSDADTAACDTLSQHSEAAIDGDEDALQALADDLGQAGGSGDPYSEKISPYAQLVSAQAQLILSGADGQLAENVGQMRGVCQAEGWTAD